MDVLGVSVDVLGVSVDVLGVSVDALGVSFGVSPDEQADNRSRVVASSAA